LNLSSKIVKFLFSLSNKYKVNIFLLEFLFIDESNKDKSSLDLYKLKSITSKLSSESVNLNIILSLFSSEEFWTSPVNNNSFESLLL